MIKQLVKLLGVTAVLSFIAVWMFHCNRFAVDQANRYQPLANGWVSHHAGMFLQNEGDFLKKIQIVVSDDLVQGRFRPAFTLYVTLPYALSPIVHHRSSAAEGGRPYAQLANGDLQLFSCILLASMAASLALMSLLIHHFTGEMLFSLIPALFIPISPALTENLLQNYIDSQEIPLILWLSSWIFFFFLAVKTERPTRRIVFFLLSFASLLLSFLAKETAVVVSVALLAVTIMIWLFGLKETSKAPFIIATAAAALCSIAVYLIVSKNHTGYAASYSLLNMVDAAKVLKKLWLCLSRYSLNNLYGYIPIFASLALVLRKRNERLNNLPASQHLLLLMLFLLLCCGFFLIMAPWQPILIKYMLPSVFFLSCAVALSLSLLTAWAKERHGAKGNLCYLLLLIYAIPYHAYNAEAQWMRNSLADQANYGVAAADQLAGSISRTMNRNSAQHQAVFVDYGTDAEWAVAPVPWGKLRLMRILNLDHGINLVDRNGVAILNYQMPGAELSSFREYPGGKTLYLSSKKKELAAMRFDAVYKGYKLTQQAAPELRTDGIGICYRKTKKRIEWQGISGAFPGFSLHKYIPADCLRKNAAESH